VIAALRGNERARQQRKAAAIFTRIDRERITIHEPWFGHSAFS
jgi:hypothetical protein